MQFSASGTLDREAMKALSHVSVFGRTDPQKRRMAWSFIYAALLVLVVLDFIWFDTDVLLITSLGSALLVYFAECYLYFVLPVLRYRALGDSCDAVYTYLLGGPQIEVIAPDGQRQIPCRRIVKVMETQAYFLIYPRGEQALVIEKATVAGGTLEDVRSWLQADVPKRYYICKY